MRLAAMKATVIGLAVASAVEARTLEDHYAPYLGDVRPAVAQWFAQTFQSYESAFVRGNGRVVDPQNRDISHSEGQGYGMLLAVLGNDREAFDRILSFAQRILKRPDNLFKWKYEPGVGTPDVNNASDGELLMASALALGAIRWDHSPYAEQARRIAKVVRRNLLIRYGGLRLLMPGEWARPSRFNPEVVVNLSYYIPFAMPLLEGVDPRGPWTELRADGRRLLEGLIHPPSDWSEVNAHGEARPATGWPKTFGYDAVRVPLYLLQVGESPATVFRFLTATWGDPEPHRDPYRFDVMSFRNLGHFHGRPYDILHELVLCAETGQPVADLTFDPRMDNYFAASLYMLTMASMYAHYQECFG